MHFNAVALQAQKHRKELLAVFDDVLHSGQFLEGAQNLQLKKSLENFLSQPAELVASGHDALILSLQALGVRKDDVVVVQANAYPSAFPVAVVGAKIVWCDVTTDGQMDPVALLHILKKFSPKAVVLTHLFGLTGDVAEIVRTCSSKKTLLIEDCAQSFGTTYKNAQLGSFGDIACYSFYPSKNLGALGDGGAVSSKNAKYLAFVHQAKQYGESQRYHSQFVAGHSRMPELQAGALSVYFQHFPEWQQKKRKVAEWYGLAIKKAKISKHVRLMQTHPNSQPTQHLLVAYVEKRDELQAFLRSRNIETLIHYPLVGADVPGLQASALSHTCETAQNLAQHILSLPYHQFLAHNEVCDVITNMAEFYTKAA